MSNNNSQPSDHQLFRQEALSHFRGGRYGGPHMGGERLSFWLTILIGILTLFLLTWLYVAHIDRKQTIVGELLPRRGVVRVRAPANGIVREKRIHDGQSIKAGDALFVLDTSRTTADRNETLEEAQQQRLEAQKSILKQQQQIEHIAGAQDLTRLDAVIADLAKQQDRFNDDILRQQQRVALSQQQLESQQVLVDEGYISAMAMAQQKSSHLQLIGETAALQRQRSELKRQQTEAQNERAAARLRAIGRLADYESQILRLEQNIGESKAKDQTVIRAPVDGSITAIAAQTGQFVELQHVMANVHPVGDMLVARLYAPDRVIGFIKPGQRIKIRYQAYPFGRFGDATGIVETVDRSLLLPQEAGAIGVKLSEATYSVTVRLADQTVTAHGQSWPLESGMALEADVLIERQRLIAWIFDPASNLGKIFRL